MAHQSSDSGESYRLVIKEAGLYRWDAALECYKNGVPLWLFQPGPDGSSDRCHVDEAKIVTWSTWPKAVWVKLNIVSLMDFFNQHQFYEIYLDPETGEKISKDTIWDRHFHYSIKCYSVHLQVFAPDDYQRLIADPEQIRLLTPERFEELIADRLAAMGFGVRLTGNLRRRDGGIDIIACRSGVACFHSCWQHR